MCVLKTVLVLSYVYATCLLYISIIHMTCFLYIYFYYCAFHTYVFVVLDMVRQISNFFLEYILMHFYTFAVCILSFYAILYIFNVLCVVFHMCCFRHG